MSDPLFIPGLPGNLELHRGKPFKLNTFVLGCKKDEYIFLEYPSDDSQYLNLEEEEPCILRFIKEGKVYGFQSYIAKIIKSPMLFLLIKYPKSIDQINLRTSIRFRVQLESVFTTLPTEGQEEIQRKGLVKDISEGGCLLSTDVSFPLKTILLLTFDLPEFGNIKNLECRVTRIFKMDNAYELGLCFQNYEDKSPRIREYLDHLSKLQITN